MLSSKCLEVDVNCKTDPPHEEPSRKKSKYDTVLKGVDRFKVIRRIEEGGRLAYDIRNENTFESSRLILEDMWKQTQELSSGSIIHICGTNKDENNQYRVERNQGFLIVEPDMLISVTSVVGMSWCERKISFSEHFRFSGSNIDTLRGTLAHDIICQALLKKIVDVKEIENEANILLKHPDVLEIAYGLGLTQKELGEMVKLLLPPISEFIKAKTMKGKGDGRLRITKVVDIEDCYWSPKYGLKGKVDCTVEAVDTYGSKKIYPVEFKTGRTNTTVNGKRNNDFVRTEHKGQVFLYSLMMNLVDPTVPSGMLHYIRTTHTEETVASIVDLQYLIMTRNRIVFNVKNYKKELSSNDVSVPFTELPKPMNVDFDRQCTNCEYINICALAIKTKSRSTEETPTKTEKKLIDYLSYLSPEEIAFFSKWMEVIRREAQDGETGSNYKDLWLKSGVQRELEGKCISSLVLDKQTEIPEMGGVLLHLLFVSNQTQYSVNFAEKDFVILGDSENPCITFGFVEEVGCLFISVSVERRLMGRYVLKDARFSIDKVSSNSTGSAQYVYLSNLMANAPETSCLRSKLVNKTAPKFSTIDISTLSKEERSILLPFNQSQRQSIFQSITTDRFLLVRGSPGCGKTTTIVGLIRLLIARKQTVLIAAYTNNALDNILLSYKKYSNDFLRIGSGGKLNENSLIPNSTNDIRSKVETVDNLRAIYDSKNVVGTTLLSLRHPVLNIKKFDYCIIDEGSQATPTVIFGAIQLAKKFVVFGDPNQLPAPIKSRRVKEMNVEENIFALLPDTQHSCYLAVQYRMNQAIMRIGNQLMYESKMRCGTVEQATDSVHLSIEMAKPYILKNYPVQCRCWITFALSRKPERSVVYLDTEDIGAWDSSVSTTLLNKKEKDIAIDLITAFIKCGINAKHIGIIAPYRGQVCLLREICATLDLKVEVNTVDQYQGREKEIIIVTFTKSVQASGESTMSSEGILNDMRRLNVAVTRAKSKLILIGNSATLKNFSACNRVLSILHSTQIYKLVPTDFPEGFFKS